MRTRTHTHIFHAFRRLRELVARGAVIAILSPAALATTYIATSANGIGLPTPTDTTTYPVQDGAATVQVPEGMVYVPAGPFTYGTGATATTMSLDGFCIGRFEVTNAEYKAFLTATGSTSYPSYWTGGTYPAGRANHPLLFVSLTQANAYAAWVSQQTGWNVIVPSAYQWEKAARGPNAYLYPWGNSLGASYNSSTGVLTAKSNYSANVTSYYLYNFPSLAATYNNANSTHYNQTVTVGTIAAYSSADVATPLTVTSTGGVTGYVDHTTYTGFIYTDVFATMNAAGGFTMPVGSYPTGVSAYGAYDVAGNAYEWTTTTFVASNGAEAGLTVNEVRGGGWYSNGTTGQSIDTGEGRSATGNYNSVGFRIAMIPAVTGTTLAISSTSPLNGGAVGVSYAQTLAASGGTGSYTWSLSTGTLPAGLALSGAGVLSGTPTAAGTSSFVVRVTDGASTATTAAFALTISASGPLDHFTWDYLPTTVNAGGAFAVRLTARDAASNLVTSYNGDANVAASSTAGSSTLSPVVITEATPGSEAQIELQNVSSATVNTTGWFVCVGDSTTNSTAGMNTPNSATFTLPSNIAAGALLRITESSTNTANGRVYFGNAIGWTNVPGNRRGWVALFDASSTLRDFVAWGWTATDIASFSITVKSKTVTLGSQWSGAGITAASGAAGSVTVDSFQRTGASDANAATGWAWYHNSDSSDATTLGATNATLTIPWSSGNTGSAALGLTPISMPFTGGEFVGYLTIAMAATNVTLTASDAASHTGTSPAFTVAAALVSTAGDGISDAWKTVNGFSTSANIATLDSDGDGASNLAEYLAGTDPRSVTSHFAVSAGNVSADGVMSLTWPGVAGKLYRINTSPDLVNWTPLSQLILVTTSGTQTTTIDTAGATKFFVRLEIAP